MKKVNKQEAAELDLVSFGKKHPVRAMLETLQPGEMVSIKRTDFSWKKKTPGVIVSELHKKGKKRFKMLKERSNTGWVVERLK